MFRPSGSSTWVMPSASGNEAQRLERVLATGRVVLATGCLLVVYPTHVGRYAAPADLLLFGYVIYSLFVLLLLRTYRDSMSSLRLLLHSLDILWPAAVSLFTESQNRPFSVFIFLFVLVAAAYRWGLTQTLVTVSCCIVLMLVEPLVAGFLRDRYPFQAHLDWDVLVVRALYLLTMGCLFGYIGENEKQLQAEASASATIVRRAQAEIGLRESLQSVLGSILELFGADQALLVVWEARNREAFLWQARRGEGGAATLELSVLESFQEERYFFDSPGQTWSAVQQGLPQGGPSFKFLALGSQGERLPRPSCSLPDYFLMWHPFRSLFAASFTFGDDEEWLGRLFLIDPTTEGDREDQLRFLHELVRQVSPAVYSVYRLRRLRSRAGSMERARFARELHDGVIQTLISLEMQLDVLRRQVEGQRGSLADALGRMQRLLRQEIINVRELIQRIRPVELRQEELVRFTANLVERFRRDTGIEAQFVSEFDRVTLPPMVAREVVRIIQEALVNVRKHSQARHVLVRLASEHDLWKLIVEDDGSGFDFSGRLSQAELDAARKGPQALKERVCSIGGELAIESTPGRGARLEIRFPGSAYG